MAAIWIADLGAVARMRTPPNQGAMNVPKELKAWVRVKRLEDVRAGPSRATYGLAETCKAVMPAARIISAARNKGNDGTLAAGIKRIVPKAMVSNPATIILW